MILTFDLGTGGAKVCVYNEEGRLHSKIFKAYETEYPAEGFHVQNPDDWWTAVKEGTAELVGKEPSLAESIKSIAISGHSLAVVPIDSSGSIVFRDIPIWSDTRAGQQAAHFFEKIEKDSWYCETGNGFTPECYSVFKLMWFKENRPRDYERISTVLGSKDYINFLLTGEISTDYSYASGSGVYSLKKREYIQDYFKAAKIEPSVLPVPSASHELVGRILPRIAEQLGVNSRVSVYCGGVDNSCMALGARNISDGSAYLSLGSSAWIAVSSGQPLIDSSIKPFIFDHVVPEMYTSATSIFSAGSSLKWFRQNIAFGLEHAAESEGRDIYDLITEAAASSSVGANGIFFNPTLGGSPEASEYSNITGAFLNLRLSSSFNDMSRAVLEGITFELYAMWKRLKELCSLSDEVVIVGGGSKSAFWRQLFADVFNCKFNRISTDQDAAALGAAAIAAVGSGVWKDFSEVRDVIRDVETVQPVQKAAGEYRDYYRRYISTWKMLSEIGDVLDD